jgi:hypothetical protein
MLETAFRLISDADQKLPLVYVVFSQHKAEEHMKRLISHVSLISYRTVVIRC